MIHMQTKPSPAVVGFINFNIYHRSLLNASKGISHGIQFGVGKARSELTLWARVRSTVFMILLEYKVCMRLFIKAKQKELLPRH